MTMTKKHFVKRGILNQDGLCASDNSPACGAYVYGDKSRVSTCNPFDVTCEVCASMINKRGVKADILNKYTSGETAGTLGKLRANALQFVTSAVEDMELVTLKGENYLVASGTKLSIENISKGIEAFKVDINIRRVKLGLQTKG